MKNPIHTRSLMAVMLIAAMATSALAPLAEASHRQVRRVRGPVVERRVVVRSVAPRVVRYHRHAPYARYTVWRSPHGPAIAGFLGGLFLGATLAHAAPAGYAYWDPYCHESFVSLDLYYSHSLRHRHDHQVYVVEVPRGYHEGDFHYCDRCDQEYWGDEHECD